MKFLREKGIYILLLIILTGFIYSFNLNNKLFWDDTDWIVHNPYVHSFSAENIKALFTKNTLAGIGEKSNYYRPLLFLTYTLNYVVSGISPLGYHIISNGLHILNVLFVFFLIDRLFHRRRMAFIAALFFAFHPLQTEAVTYISGRGDPLSVFFMFSALWLYLNYIDKKKIVSMIGSLALFVFAILSREVATIFPLFVLAITISLEHSSIWKSFWRGLRYSLPYFAIAGIYAILRLTVFNFKDTLNFYVQNNIYTQHLSYRIFTFFSVLLQYLKLIFIPSNLHMERSVALRNSLFQWPVWLVALGLLALIAFLIYLYRKERSSKAVQGISTFRLWFLGISFFFIWLIPSSGIVPVNALLYEHWLYFSLFGFFMLVAFYIDSLIEYSVNQGNSILQILVVVALVIYLGVLGWISIQRNRIWGDPVAFYNNILTYEPDSVRIHNNLGNTYFDLGDKDNAEKQYWLAVKEEDIFPQPHFNLGSILQERGDNAGAIAEYLNAIKIDPDFHYAYQNLAIIYAQQGIFTKAEQYASKLVELRYQDPRVYYNLALIQLAQKNVKTALETLKTGLPYADRDAEARKDMEDLIVRLSSKK